VARCAAGEPLPPPDASRYRLEPPAGAAAGDAAAWAAAVDNAKAQLEHQALRVQNLELLLRYGANTWAAHVRGLGAACTAAAASLAAAEGAAAALHAQRKVQQQAAGAELRGLERAWRAAVDKNADIAAACDALEAEAEALRHAGAGAAAGAGADGDGAAAMEA
jgi:pre-mRNA-splicing factor SPF27